MKILQWFGHVKILDIKNTATRDGELEMTGKHKPNDDSNQDDLNKH